MGVGGIAGGSDPDGGVSGPGDIAGGADPVPSGDPTSGGFGGTPQGGGLGSGPGSDSALADSGYSFDVDYGFEGDFPGQGMLNQAKAAMSDSSVGLALGLGHITGITPGGLVGATLGAVLGGIPGALAGFSIGQNLSGDFTAADAIALGLGLPFGGSLGVDPLSGLVSGFAMASQFSDLADSLEGFSFGDDVSSDTGQAGSGDYEIENQSTEDNTDYDLRARLPYMGDFASVMAEPPKDNNEKTRISELSRPLEGTLTSKLESPSDFFSTAKFFQQEEGQDNELW